MPTTKPSTTTCLAILAGSALFLLGTQTASWTSLAPRTAHGQEVQPGQNDETTMTRQQAEEVVEQGNENQVGQSTQSAGRPDLAAEQGAMPSGVGYDNNPGELYDPAVGHHTYIHHYIHHYHHDGSQSAPPPSGYVRGAYVVPDNENPNDRRSHPGMIGAYNLPIQHTYHGNVTHNYYGGYPQISDGSGVPSGFFGAGGNTSAGTTWGRFGAWHPNAFDGAGAIGGFTD